MNKLIFFGVTILFFVSLHAKEEDSNYQNTPIPNYEIIETTALIDILSESGFILETDSSIVKVHNSNWTYGYGIWGIMVMLPGPFVEAGIKYNAINIRSSLCYGLTYAEAKAEVAVITHINNRESNIFLSAGIISAMQLGVGNYYGIGVDLISKNESRYFRGELGHINRSSNYNSFYLWPRIGIGWRMDYRPDWK